MRVAIIHYTAPPVVGGAERVIRQQALLLASHGHKVTVIAGRGGIRGLGAGSTRAHRTGETRPDDGAGMTFERVPLLAATHPVQRRIEAALANGVVPSDFHELTTRIGSELEPLLRRETVVLAHNVFTLHFNAPLTAALGMLAEKDLCGRIVAWTHDIAAINPLYEAELHPGFPWELFTTPQPGVRYVAISKARKDELISLWTAGDVHPHPEPTVIPNGIDPASILGLSGDIVEVTRKLRLFDQEIVIVLPVRITRRKNIELAIEVVAALRRRGRAALLLVTGSIRGHHPARSRGYLSELQQLAIRLEVRNHVVFLADTLGRSIRDAEISHLYSAGTLLLLPSRSEGFGLPLVEAALSRLPIVASDLPVFREIASDRARYFSPDAPAEEVATLVEDAAATPLAGLRAEVLRDYAWDAVYVRHMLPLLQEMAGNVHG